ncbi:MAG: lipoprotein insertase outer membrane protein LolB [Granulosicoccaceae bacterium]
MSANLHSWLVITVVLLLVSCVTPQAVQNRVSSATLTHFEVSGGLGIWTDKENISTRMHWQQRADDFSFDLTAPLGSASLRVDQRDNRTTVTRGNAVVASSADPGIALQQALGLSVPVPVSQIAQWLKGQPGDADTTTFNDAGLLQSLRYTDQSGISWNAVIRKRKVFQDAQVPALITATGGPYNVRIVLKTWQSLKSEPTEGTPIKSPTRLVIPTQ